MKRLIIASTSTIYGGGYLDYLLPELDTFFGKTDSIIFIPYARPGGISYNSYTQKAKQAFAKIGINVRGIHEFDDPEKILKTASALFVGGGNTFELVNQLYKKRLMKPLKEAIEAGAPYLGTSAGSNICGISMKNTNDMPIVYPPNFNTMGLIPFNINAHYIDPDPKSTHMGETRETRIKEFHVFNEVPVLGLREGSWLEVNDDSIKLKGGLSARWFQKDKEPIEILSGSLMNQYFS